MSPQAKPRSEQREKNETTSLDDATDMAISACGGDVRGAIQALLIANKFLEQRNQELARFLSLGFVRGQLPANNEFEDSLTNDL